MAAKTDMERIGLFSEMGYTSIGDPYVPPNSKSHGTAGKGKQMIPGGTKGKSALQDGYFGKAFDRVMVGEAYSDPVKHRRQMRLKEAKKNIGKAWVPSSGSKKPSGLGNHYGTLGGPTEALSAALRPKEKYKAPGKNFITNPGKMGTGYGYVGVTIGPGHKYSSEPYDRTKELRKKEHDQAKKKVKGGPFKLNTHPKDLFDENPYRSDKSLPPAKEVKDLKEKFKPFKPSSPAKLAGGCKAGTFDPYPKHAEEPYQNPKVIRTPDKTKGGVFKPSPCPKSMPTRSVVQQNVTRRMNVSNFLSASPTT